MTLKYLALGFFVKIITGFDDTITHIPVLAAITRTRLGRIAFSVGTLFAIGLAIVISLFFASFIKQFTFYKYIIAALLFALAIIFAIGSVSPRYQVSSVNPTGIDKIEAPIITCRTFLSWNSRCSSF